MNANAVSVEPGNGLTSQSSLVAGDFEHDLLHPELIRGPLIFVVMFPSVVIWIPGSPLIYNVRY